MKWTELYHKIEVYSFFFIIGAFVVFVLAWLAISLVKSFIVRRNKKKLERKGFEHKLLWTPPFGDGAKYGYVKGNVCIEDDELLYTRDIKKKLKEVEE
jgi:hypothetical protein